MKRALVSVSDKTNLVSFVKGLAANGYEIVSTGGTKKVLDDAGISTISIEDVTHFPEILDGRVKTLNPYVHGGLLARRELPEHMAVYDGTVVDIIIEEAEEYFAGNRTAEDAAARVQERVSLYVAEQS